MKIYLDGRAVYAKDASRIDTYVSASSGSHRLTIQAWDAAGTIMKKDVYVNVSSTSSGSTASSMSHYDIEEKSGWHACSDCANAGGEAVYSMTQGVSSPSQDGRGAKFFLGGTKPWSHSLYHRRMGENSRATNFVYEVNYYYKNPGASSGMEFSASQRKDYKWYRWDTQCSYLLGNWRLWDNANRTWRDISVPCTRPKAYSWTKVIFEGKRVDGKVQFVSITVNGKKYYINRSYYPTPKSYTSSAINIHFQLNGDRYQSDYTVWGDNFKLTYW